MPRKSKLTSTKGDLPANRISIMQLLERLELTGEVQADAMLDELGVDRGELEAILDHLAKHIPRDPYLTTQSSLRGVLSWGIAIGYFYAKQARPIQMRSAIQ